MAGALQFEGLVRARSLLMTASMTKSFAVLVAATALAWAPTAFAGSQTNGAQLNGAQLNGAQLNGAQLNGAQLNGAQLNGLWLNGAQLNGAQLNGAQLNGAQLNGTNVTGTLSNGSQVTLRIDNAQQVPYMESTCDVIETCRINPKTHEEVCTDKTVCTWANVPSDGPNSDIWLYNVTNAANGQSICPTTDAFGTTLAMPVAGRWNVTNPGGKDANTSSTYFTFSCRDAALAKCAERQGYKPWASFLVPNSNGWYVSGDWYHQTCVRMVRADYCGDGSPHTVNGTPIDVYDGINVQSDDGSQTAIEAEWTPVGARCISAYRWSSLDPTTGGTVGGYAQSACYNNSFKAFNGVTYYTPTGSSTQWICGQPNPGMGSSLTNGIIYNSNWYGPTFPYNPGVMLPQSLIADKHN